MSPKSIGPALTLMVLAPLVAEVLPGATRFSSLFVFPIEVLVWGGGALLIRYAVSRWQLGWWSMLSLALALAVAEECLIQQTSLAPMVIRLKGVTYARAFGLNYVYFFWALIYEAVFVVFLPVYLTELIYPSRKEGLWIRKAGLFTVIPLFILGSFLAWFTWTQIARTKVFHVPVYHPPYAALVTAVAAMGVLTYLAFGPLRRIRSLQPSTRRPAAPGVRSLAPGWVGTLGGIWAIGLYGMVLLGFGEAPDFPPLVAVAAEFVLFAIVIVCISHATAGVWNAPRRMFSLIFGIMLGSMTISFLGFIWSGGPDLYFKIIVNVIAVALMIMLGRRIKNNLPA